MRTSGDCGDRRTQPVCLVYLGLTLLRVSPVEALAHEATRLPQRAAIDLVSPLFGTTGGLPRLRFGRFIPNPEAADVC